jgi:hypothetical protein
VFLLLENEKIRNIPSNNPLKSASPAKTITLSNRRIGVNKMDGERPVYNGRMVYVNSAFAPSMGQFGFAC